MNIEISQEVVNELAFLAYKSWSDAFTVLKQVREEKNDNSKDWILFHRDRLTAAINDENKKELLKHAIIKHSSLGDF